MKQFKTPRAMYGEIKAMENAERYRREDRATVGDFFNGAPPLTDEEAADLGFTVNVNHLFGYKDVSDASDQMFSLFTKPTHFFTVEMDSAPPGKAIEWSMKAQAGAARVIKKIKSFKTHSQGVCGDATLHGEGIFHFVNCSFPLPRHAPLSKFMVPKSASTDPAELPYFVRQGELGLAHLHRIAKLKPPGWKTSNVNRILAELYETDDGKSDGVLNVDNLEQLEYDRQENSATTERRKTSWEVYYFYQRRGDLAGQPIDLTILLKDSAEDEVGDDAKDNVLYEGEGQYPSISTILHPIFMDCIIGGEMKWHRVLGLGHLNYSVNQTVEMMINRAQQATVEGSMNLWKATNQASRDGLEQVLLQHNGIIPEGMELMPNRFEPNFSGLLEMIQFFRQQGSKNARGITPNNGDSNNQLEVQAINEQNQAASASNNRTSNAYDYFDGMWEEVFARLTNPFIDPREPGYSEVMDFQNEMEREGVDLYRLQAWNVTVRSSRIVGDGMRSKELSIAAFLTANRAMFAPQVQPRITRIITGAALDNHTLAEELTPIQEAPDVPQDMRAEAENSSMITSRLKQEPKADDIDALHIPKHFAAMETLANDGLQFQKGAFTPPQAAAFKMIGSHVAMHIHRIQGQAMQNQNDSNRVMAAEFMQQLTKIAAMGDKLEHNMQQAGQADAKEVDPMEMEKMKLEMQKLEFNRHKLQLTTQLKDRQLHGKEQQTAFQQHLALEKNLREAAAHRQNLSMNDVQTALAVRESNKPAPANA